jgi:hypothetical protein
MEFNTDDMSYSAPGAVDRRIKTDTTIRLKVIGLSAQATTLCGIGSINEAHLGLLD